jgi:hypothetical protein
MSRFQRCELGDVFDQPGKIQVKRSVLSSCRSSPFTRHQAERLAGIDVFGRNDPRPDAAGTVEILARDIEVPWRIIAHEAVPG